MKGNPFEFSTIVCNFADTFKLEKIAVMLKNILLVGLGGALGSMARYLLTYVSAQWAISGEWAILLANVLGSFLIGMLIF